MSSIVCIPIWSIYKIYSIKGSFTERLHQLTSPDVELPQRLLKPEIISDPSQRPSETVHRATADHDSNC
ncbi:hypothetical protein NDU88_006389 [Pleurodeles waltl]|uniref:Uncharacterized protein n=2 Tax=Pleurodeles waltl TaxID=8319 RepID=A0AAV7SPG8_PLEWA|nr:hypothetical protein NDU88_006389 [Pleurodeles waltl]